MRLECKQTEIGEIPEDWDVCPLGQLFDSQLGKMLDEEKNRGELKPYLGNRAVKWGQMDLSNLSHMRMMPTDQIRYRLKSGDLLVCEGGEVGRCAIWRGQIEECYYQKALHRLRPRGGMNTEFLAAVLHSFAERGLFSNFVTQTSIAHLPKEKLVLVPLPVPAIEEQIAISSALSDADAVIASLERLIAKKRDLKQAAMQQLLTAQSRLPGFGGEWHEKRLGDLAAIKTGPFGAQLHERDYVESGTPIITVEHLGEFGIETSHDVPKVSEADLKRLSNYQLRDGDIVFSRVGSVDRNALVRSCQEGWLFSGRLLRLRFTNSIEPPFMSHLFHSEPFKKKVLEVAVGQTMASLNTRILADISVLLPTDRAEQISIANILSDMNGELVTLEAQLEKTRLIKRAMMQELLTGRTRLPIKEAVDA